MTRYAPGTRVTFADANATVSDGLEGLRTGTVNGEPVRDEDGVIRFVPVWADRDHGREATTIMVAVENVLGVTR